MTLIYCVMLFLFPVLSSAFTCHYNDRRIVLRKTVLLELEDQNYIHIRDAIFEIIPKNKTSESTLLIDENVDLIEEISFKGFLTKKNKEKYVNVTLNNMKSYRFQKSDNGCRVSYQNTKSKGLNITSEEEYAIMRLAESCIQSRVCGISLLEMDKDSDLYYQSTQSSLNELVDFYVPKLLDLLLDDNKNLELPAAEVSVYNMSLSAKGGILKGIDTIQRTNDVVIKHNESIYNVILVARFKELDVLLNDVRINYGFVGTSVKFEAKSHGVSLKTFVTIDLQPPTCKVKLDNIQFLAFKNIQLSTPVWGSLNVSYNFNSKSLWFFEKAILQYIIESIPVFEFDCQQYLDDLAKLAR